MAAPYAQDLADAVRDTVRRMRLDAIFASASAVISLAAGVATIATPALDMRIHLVAVSVLAIAMIGATLSHVAKRNTVKTALRDRLGN